jgi:HEAT repeat protein
VREAAARALGKIGDTRAVEPLVEALKDDIHVRWRAAEALLEIGKTSASVEPLVEALKDEDSYVFNDWHVREAAAEALVKIGGASVEPGGGAQG